MTFSDNVWISSRCVLADATFNLYTVFGRAQLDVIRYGLFALYKILFKENLPQRRFSAEQVAEMPFADSDESEIGADPERFDSEEDQIVHGRTRSI